MMKLIAGPWGDLSEDFHILLGTFAKNRAEAEARSKGRGGGKCRRSGKTHGTDKKSYVSSSGKESELVST